MAAAVSVSTSDTAKGFTSDMHVHEARAHTQIFFLSETSANDRKDDGGHLRKTQWTIRIGAGV
jgi:hypothetical protein